MCLPLERIWQNADVTFRSFPKLERKAEGRTTAKSGTDSCGSDAEDGGAKPERYDHLRDKRLDEELQIKRPPNRPSGSKSKKKRKGSETGGTDEEPAPDTTAAAASTAVSTTTSTTAAPEPGASEVATDKQTPEKPEKPEKPKKVRKTAPKRALLEYHEVTKPIAMVDGLAILGRGDIFTKRKWWLPENDPQITEGSHGITGIVAAQMQRSLEYTKRENRPRIICKSVDQYCIESR